MNHRPIVCCWVLLLAVAWVPCRASGSPAPTAELPVASLSQSAFVLDARGTLFAWEDNQRGQLGIGPKSANPRAEEPLPVAVPFPAGVKRWLAMASGSWHSLAIGDDGRV